MTDVFTVLSRLGIRYSQKDLKRGELSFKCPFHNEKTPGGFSINVENWKFNCFSCLTKGIGPESFVSKYLNISWKEAKKWLEDNELISSENVYEDYTDNLVKKEIEEIIENSNKKDNVVYMPDTLERLNTDNFYYLKDHNINQVFIDNFKWFYSNEGYYKDYIIVPIYFNKKIVTFEARKLLEYEKLCEYYNERFLSEHNQLTRLRKQLKDEKLKLKDKLILKNGKPFYVKDKRLYFLLKYLLLSKVLYPKGSNINDYIYNYDNLDKTEILHVVESTSSVSNIWLNISENVTALMGAQISEKQIELLNKFKDIIFYPDIDEAGLLLTERLKDDCTSNIDIIEVNSVENASKKELRQKPENIRKFIYRKLQELHKKF